MQISGRIPPLPLPASVPGCVNQMWPALGLSASAISGTLSTVSACPADSTQILLLELLDERQQFPEADPSTGFPGRLVLALMHREKNEQRH